MTVTFHGSHYSGVSGDTKPTLTSTDAGALFAETNTDQLHVWNGSGWDAALATSTMTLTNKTLTAPDINAGTVDAITSLTVANNVDVGNYTVRANNFLADSHTATRVFFAGTDGVLASDSDFTFATDTLTVTKLGAFEATGAIDFSDEAMTNVNIDSGAIDGVTLGTNSVITQAVIDNVTIKLVSTIAQYIPNSVVDGETSRFKPDWDELDGSFKWGRLVE